MQPGQRLLHYRLVGKIGQGGMGEVYRATDTKLGRDVALKVLPPEVAGDPARIERFRREARAIAALNHPNIVTIHSVEEADGHSFLTMERVDGVTLDTRIGADGMPIASLLKIAEPLAAAVAAAHDQGVVHRDLKPANVMVARDGTVKVLDFGLAKLAAPDASPSGPDLETATVAHPVTDAGAVMGTVPYMSPEQARGEPVDSRTDLFSLGILIYQMATGRLPFRGKTPADTLSSILRDVPPPVTEVNPDLPERLGRLIRRCLEKDPEHRMQSARDLSLELRELRRDVESGAVPATARPPRTRRASIAVAAVAVLAVVAVLAAWFVRRDPGAAAVAPDGETAPEQEMIVVFPFDNLGAAEDEYFAAGIAEEISSRLAGVGSLGVVSRSSAFQYEREGKSMARIGEDLGVDYVLEGTVRWAGSASGARRVRVTPSLIDVATDRQLWSTSFDETLEEIFDVQSRIAQHVLDQLDLELSATEERSLAARPTDDLDAYQAYLRGLESSRSEKSYSVDAILETIGHFERAVERDPDFALAWAGLADSQSWFYHLRYDTSEERRERARRAAERALELDPDLPRAHLSMGLYHYRCHRDYERALVELSVAATGLPNAPEVHESIGAVRRRLGEFESAARAQERAFRLDPRDATAAWDVGVTYACLGRYDEALAWVDRAIDIDPSDAATYGLAALMEIARNGDLTAARDRVEAMPPGDSPFIEMVRLTLLVFERDYAAALDRLEAATWDKLDHTTSHEPRALWLGNIHHLMGHEEAARSAYLDALDLIDRELETRGDDARIHVARGFALAGLGRREEAIAEGKRAIELYPSSLDRFHGPHHELDLAKIYLRAGDVDRGLEQLEHVVETAHGLVINVPGLKLDPAYDGVRDDPRFRRLLVDDR